MKLFGHPDSGHAFKVRFFLMYAGIDHEYEVIDIFSPREARSAQFRKHARYGEVPLLLQNGQAYVQSNAILAHLAQQTQRFGAENATHWQRSAEWLFWEANKIGLCLPQLRASNKFPEMKLSDGAKNWLLARFESDVGTLNNELSDGRPFIMGGEPTVADFSLSGYLFFADEAAVALPGHVQTWLNNLASLPGWEHPYELLKQPKQSNSSEI